MRHYQKANQTEQMSPLQVASKPLTKWASLESIKCVTDFWDLIFKLMEDSQDYQCSGKVCKYSLRYMKFIYCLESKIKGHEESYAAS